MFIVDILQTSNLSVPLNNNNSIYVFNIGHETDSGIVGACVGQVH